MKKLRIGIDARIAPGKVGGVQTYIEGLAEGFGQYIHSDIQLVWLASDKSWLQEQISSGDEIYEAAPQHAYDTSNENQHFKDSRFQNHWFRNREIDSRIPREPKIIKELNLDGIHFCSQDAFSTNLPSIYHPHDLQHIHMPENFSTEDIGWRSLAWPYFAGAAKYVVCGSIHVANDIKEFWNIPERNIRVLRLGTSKKEIFWQAKNSETKVILYPSAYYVHKNHERFLRAVKSLVDEGLKLEVHLTGGRTEEINIMQNLIVNLGLSSNCFQSGYISQEDLISMYLTVDMVVVPTLYESASFPILECKSLGVPVICADIDPLKNQIEDPTSRFNPYSVEEIARTIKSKLFISHPSGIPVEATRTWKEVCEEYAEIYRELS